MVVDMYMEHLVRITKKFKKFKPMCMFTVEEHYHPLMYMLSKKLNMIVIYVEYVKTTFFDI